MANMTASLYSNEINKARDLIQAALESRATVAAADSVGGASKGGRVDVQPSRGERTRLTLVPYTLGQDGAAKRNSVLVLNRASRRTLERLRLARRCFVDIGRGIVFLDLPNLLVDRTDLRITRRKSATRPLRNPFADHASFVSRTLADHPGRTWKSRELAAFAGVSTMTASHVVRQLHRAGVVDVHQLGRSYQIRLPDVFRLMEVWAASYDWSRNPHVSMTAPIGDARRFLPKLNRLLSGRRWALTMHAGASLVAPHAAWDKIHLYVEVRDTSDLQEILQHHDYQRSDQGRLVVMRPWYRDSVWHGLRLVRGLPVVSDVQLTLDLWHYEVRGREQAEYILNTSLSEPASE